MQRPQTRDSQGGRATADLRGASVFATEPFPRDRHHPAEALLLLHEVAASAVCGKPDRRRGRRRSLHIAGSARSRPFPPVPLPLTNVAARGGWVHGNDESPQNRKEVTVAGEVQSSFVPSVYRFPPPPPPPRELSAKLKLVGTGPSLQPGPRAGPTGLLHPPVGGSGPT